MDSFIISGGKIFRETQKTQLLTGKRRRKAESGDLSPGAAAAIQAAENQNRIDRIRRMEEEIPKEFLLDHEDFSLLPVTRRIPKAA